MAVIEAKDYRFYYPEQSEPALRIDELTVEKGAFCLLAGASGSGKTTLLRQLSGNTAWQGREEGELICRNKGCGYVWQNPASQIVTDRVEYEIVFGLENIGMPKEKMQRRLAEVVTFFGLEELMNRDTMNLSGGEMQTLNVAAAVAMNPELLLLDEPVSQLDPVAARRLYELLRQINEELGITVVIAEQRLEEVVSLADTMVLMQDGEILAKGRPGEVYRTVRLTSERRYFPSYMQIYPETEDDFPHMVSKKKARQWFTGHYRAKSELSEEPIGMQRKLSDKKNMFCQNLFFRYEKSLPDVVKECSCEIPLQAVTCLAGGNGSGKTTLLQILSGRYRPYHGKIKNLPENISLLPQQPLYLFLEETLEREFHGQPKRVQALIHQFGLEKILERHPADVSGGEIQRLALCLVLGREADLYLLDEPTKGMDEAAKIILGDILSDMTEQGKTILMVSHDMEFAARTAEYMALMFQGRVELLTDTRSFFEENQFYTTGINRIARDVSEHIITIKDVERYAEKKMD